jgi:hypothetical protein
VNNDKRNWTTKLKVDAVEWSTVTSEYSLNWGPMHLGPTNYQQFRRQKRDLWLEKLRSHVKDDLQHLGQSTRSASTHFIQDLGQGIKGASIKIVEGTKNIVRTGHVHNKKEDGEEDGHPHGRNRIMLEDWRNNVEKGEFSRAAVIDVTGGNPGKTRKIFTDPTVKPPRLNITCSDCYMKGQFRIAGQLRVTHRKIRELRLVITPSNFKVNGRLRTVFNLQRLAEDWNYKHKYKTVLKHIPLAKVKFNSYSFNHDIFKVPIPGMIVVVPKVFKLGIAVSVEVAFILNMKGKLDFISSLEASLPDTAVIIVDLISHGHSQVSGIEGMVFKPYFKVQEVANTFDGSISWRPKIALDAEVTAAGKVSAELRLGLPQVNVNSTLIYKEGGACKGSDSETAIKFATGGIVNFVFSIPYEVRKEKKIRLYDRVLASISLYQFLQCFPLNLPV